MNMKKLVALGMILSGSVMLPGCQQKRKTDENGQSATVYALSGDGVINNWLILGPFPNPGDRPDNAGYDIDYLKDFGGEANHVPALRKTITRPDGTPIQWLPYQAEYAWAIDVFSVDHLNLDYNAEDILIYAACWLECDMDMDVELRIGSDDGYKMWLDHERIAARHVYRSLEPDSEIYPVTLKKGRHLLLLKVDQDWGDFMYIVRVTAKEGGKAQGITISLEGGMKQTR